VEGQGQLHQTRNFGGISRPQDNATDLTNTVDTFEKFFDKDMVQKIANEPNS
jgi:hypothetical protein